MPPVLAGHAAEIVPFANAALGGTDAAAPQAFTFEGRRAWISFDGRLDDREALWRDLDIPFPLAATSDAELAISAFEAWGLRGFERLLGSWALALWDPLRRTALLARDPLGGRCLSWSRSRTWILASTSEARLVDEVGAHDDLDPERIASYFALETPRGGQTFFRNIQQLGPGEVLTITPEGVSSRHLDRPRPAAISLDANAGERAEELRHRLDRAVRSRLGVGRPAVLLSGGLDSSPIAACARAAEPGRPLAAVSWIFERYPRADEREYLDAMDEHLGLEIARVPCDDAMPLADFAAWPVHPSTPEQNAYRLFHERAYRVAAERGWSVVLSGMCGDQLYSGAEFQLRERLVRGDFAGALRWALRAARHDSQGLREAVGALLPAGLRLERSARRRAEQASWLTDRAVALLPDVIARDAWANDYPRPAQALALLGPDNGHGFAIERTYAEAHGIELRYPLRDRRVIEWMLAVPAEDLADRGVERPILRRAFAGRLPERVLERRGKATFEDLFIDGVHRRARRDVDALLNHRSALWQEFVDPSALEGRGGMSSLLHWLALSFELWRVRRAQASVTSVAKVTEPFEAQKRSARS